MAFRKKLAWLLCTLDFGAGYCQDNEFYVCRQKVYKSVLGKSAFSHLGKIFRSRKVSGCVPVPPVGRVAGAGESLWRVRASLHGHQMLSEAQARGDQWRPGPGLA